MKKFYQACAFLTYFLLMETIMTYQIKPFHLAIYLLILLIFLVLSEWKLELTNEEKDSQKIKCDCKSKYKYNVIELNVAKDFSTTPGGRFKKNGSFSGEEFRDNILIPKYFHAIAQNKKLLINLDGCFAYPSVFLDEAFSGLVLNTKYSNVAKNISIISEDQPSLEEDIFNLISIATLELKKENVK
jgi:hypothetical protein